MPQGLRIYLTVFRRSRGLGARRRPQESVALDTFTWAAVAFVILPAAMILLPAGRSELAGLERRQGFRPEATIMSSVIVVTPWRSK